MYTKAESAANPLSPPHYAYGISHSFVFEQRSVALRDLYSKLQQ